MKTYPRAATLEMPFDVLADLRTRASVDENRVTAKMHALPPEVARLGSDAETLAVGTKPAIAVAEAAPVESAPLEIRLRAPSKAATPPTVAVHLPQRSVNRLLVIGASFAVTLGLGLLLAL